MSLLGAADPAMKKMIMDMMSKMSETSTMSDEQLICSLFVRKKHDHYSVRNSTDSTLFCRFDSLNSVVWKFESADLQNCRMPIQYFFVKSEKTVEP